MFDLKETCCGIWFDGNGVCVNTVIVEESGVGSGGGSESDGDMEEYMFEMNGMEAYSDGGSSKDNVSLCWPLIDFTCP